MTKLIAHTIRKNGYWIAIFDGYPTGGVAADTLAELHQEVEAVKVFVVGLPADADVDIEYAYDHGVE